MPIKTSQKIDDYNYLKDKILFVATKSLKIMNYGIL
jgi:hypothetical protein